MKTLVLITSQFPFGAGEAFLETEFPFLNEEFEKTIIISQNILQKSRRPLPGNVKVVRYDTKTSLSGLLLLPLLVFRNIYLIISTFENEIKFRKSIQFPLSKQHKVFLLRKIIKAIQLSNFIRRHLRKENIETDVTFYSYWLNSGAHAISFIDIPRSIKIARAHGSDLYEEKSQYGYLPLLDITCRKLDKLFFISENGLNYFSSKTLGQNKNLKISRLGVCLPEKETGGEKNKESFSIVSCSNLIPLKRIHFIIESLSKLESDRNVEWFHFGDGILMKELKVLAAEKLHAKKNINYSFMGHYSNNDLMKFYKDNHIDLFINTSSTEGVPVSIMEAQSFGIPAIATDVGGVKELVRKGTGFLLDVDFREEELTEKIQYFINLDPEEMKSFRLKALSNWEENYNASKNYRQFITEVNSILAAKK